MLIAAIASSVVVGVLYTGFVVRMLWLESPVVISSFPTDL
jgi:hypothetical protein